MKSFIWSIHGTIISALFLSINLSIFNWILPIFVSDQLDKQQERQRLEKESEEALIREQEVYLTKAKAQYKALGMIYKTSN